jgi:hypothetical protein
MLKAIPGGLDMSSVATTVWVVTSKAGSSGYWLTDRALSVHCGEPRHRPGRSNSSVVDIIVGHSELSIGLAVDNVSTKE